jgi:hypothetical protein
MPNALKINNQEISFSGSPLVLDEQVAELSVDIKGWSFTRQLIFHPNAGGASRAIRGEATPTHLRLHFDKWVDTLGSALAEPINVARLSGGQIVYASFFHNRVGSLNRVDVQLALGGSNG